MPLEKENIGCRRVWSCLSVLPGLVSTLAAASTEPTAGALQEYQHAIAPLLQKYCYDCHGDGSRKGKVAFDEFGSDADVLENSKLWLAALKNVRAGLMPPADGGPRPTPTEIAALARWVKYGVLSLDPADPDPGRVTARRLNRIEYRNTIRDLLGFDFNAEAEFPPDDSGNGFDNIGDVLSVSPLHLEKYFRAAETIINAVVPKTSRVIRQRRITGSEFRTADEKATGEAMTMKSPRRVSYACQVDEAERYRVIFDLQIKYSSNDFDPGHCQVVATIDGARQFATDVSWRKHEPLHYEFEASWTTGSHQIALEIVPLEPLTADHTAAPNEKVSALFPSGASIPSGLLPVAPKPRADVGIVAVTIEGPSPTRAWVEPPNYRRFFPRGPAPDSAQLREQYATEILREFATCAFRRPPEPRKINQLVRIARETYTQPGKTFEQGVGQAMMAVLASPYFIFRFERSQPQQAAQRFADVDDYTLASRLSYFFWSTMPDAELFALAAKGELRPQLPAQVRRMLRDERSQALARNFVGQWLQARDVEVVPINARAAYGLDTRRKANEPRLDFYAPLRKAMRAETETYFSYVMHEDRSVLELLDSNYAFLNAALAGQYDVPGINGEQLRRVVLPENSPRGGVLTQGTILAVTSNPTRTSPVKRGLFILENILGTPPPPPPDDVPALEAAKDALHGDPTGREMLAEHRRNPACAGCHARMDPLGFAFENFNAVGGWRDEEAAQPIDASGQLLTGESFADLRALKHILTHERRLDFYRCLTEKLLTYALGRGLQPYDLETVDRIVERLDSENGRFSALLAGVIESAPFLRRRNRDDAPVYPAASVSPRSAP